MITEQIPPGATAAGHCHRCGKWSAQARIVAEIPSNSGSGATVVRCPDGCPSPGPDTTRRHPL